MTKLMYFVTLALVLPWIIWMGYSSPTLAKTDLGTQSKNTFLNLSNTVQDMIPRLDTSSIVSIVLTGIDSVFGILKGVFLLLVNIVTAPFTIADLVAADLPEPILLGLKLILSAVMVISAISWYSGRQV